MPARFGTLRKAALLGLMGLAILGLTGCPTGITSRVSVDSNGAQADGPSTMPSISYDGNYVAFSSEATNLMLADDNGFPDVYVHSRDTTETFLMSMNMSGGPGNGPSIEPDIAGEAEAVVFTSYANDLVPDDDNGKADVFMAGVGIVRVSVSSDGSEADGDSTSPTVSADGARVAYVSEATNLVDDDGNGVADVFVSDGDDTVRVSVGEGGVEATGGPSASPSISADGRYVAFSSEATNLVDADTNDCSDIFLHDADTGDTKRLSVDSLGIEGNGGSFNPAISPDGLYVAFSSDATNLQGFEWIDGKRDVFLHDVEAGTTILVSEPRTDGDGGGDHPSVSNGGEYVAYESLSRVDPVSTRMDIVLYDSDFGGSLRILGVAEMAAANGICTEPDLTPDGGMMAFSSEATNLMGDVGIPPDANSTALEDTNGCSDVYVHVFDRTPPVTGSDAVASYEETANIELLPDDGDGVGVAETFWQLDESGMWMLGTTIETTGIGSHSLDFYSVDEAENVEETTSTGFTVNMGTTLEASSGPPAIAYGCDAGLEATLTRTTTGEALEGRTVVFERQTSSGWEPVGDPVLTNAAGECTTTVAPEVTTTYRAHFLEADYYADATSSSRVVGVRPYLSNPIMPARVRRNAPFNCYGYLKPRHTAGGYPVRLYGYHLSGGVWFVQGFIKAKASNYSNYSKYSRAVAIGHAGKWRIKAYAPRDSGHLSTYSSGSRYFVVR